MDTLDDCLCLLDGRLVHLLALYVRIHNIQPSEPDLDNRVRIFVKTYVFVLVLLFKVLTNLKSFSLTACRHTQVYGSHIVPLLRRMICLEQLMLCLTIVQQSIFIDGTHLENEILIHMPTLQKFSFNIITYTKVTDEINQQLIDDIRRTFLNKRFPQVGCYIGYHRRRTVRSHIYSLPYTMNEILQISNSFLDEFFPNVRRLLLSDSLQPFEHDFFNRITQAFPLLTYLSVSNRQPQRYKRSNHSNEENCVIPTVEFSYLTRLTIIYNHIDYVEQFLVETNTRLPRLMRLDIRYEHLEIVTESFTRDATRQNCSKLDGINFCESIVHAEKFYLYFPNHK
jgi:hypothetical protein